MSGLVGKKIGMTSLFDENGKNVPCTIIEAGPCTVTQVKNMKKTVTVLYKYLLKRKRRN